MLILFGTDRDLMSRLGNEKLKKSASRIFFGCGWYILLLLLLCRFVVMLVGYAKCLSNIQTNFINNGGPDQEEYEKTLILWLP